MTIGGGGEALNVGNAFVKIRPNTLGFGEEARAGIAGHLKGIVASLAGIFAAKKVFDFTKGAIEAAREYRVEERLTAAVLKSTGDASHVTASGVDHLTDSLSQHTGITESAIRVNENLLLRFTGVRNEVGKGNDIFNQASKAVLDLSVGLGKDGTAAAKALGRALNDPLKGLSLLSRSGVAFTQQQKDQIKQMVSSGHLLQAQKLILHQVGVAFGGAAVAAADPGKKLAAVWEHVKVVLGEKLLPIIDVVAGWFADKLPGALDVVIGAFRSFGQTVSWIWDDILGGFQNPDATFGPGFKTIDKLFITLGATVRHVWNNYLQPVVQWLHEHMRIVLITIGAVILAFVLPPLVSMALAAFAVIAPFVLVGIAVYELIQALGGWHAVMAKVEPVVKRVWEWLKVHLLPVVKELIGWFRDHWKPILIGAAAAFALIVAPIPALVAGLLYLWVHFEGFRNVVTKVFTAVVRAVEIAVNWLVDVAWPKVQQFIGVIVDQAQKFGAYWAERWDDIKLAVEHVLKAILIIAAPLIGALLYLWHAFGGTVLSILKIAFNTIVSVIKGAFQIIKGIFDIVLGLLSGDWGRAWDGIKSVFSGAWHIIIALLHQFISVMLKVFGALLHQIANVLKSLGLFIWQHALSPALHWVWSKIKAILHLWLLLYVQLPLQIVKAIAHLGQTVWHGIVAGLNWFKDTALAQWIRDVLQFFTDLPGRIVSGLSNIGHVLWDGIKSGLGWFHDRISDAVDTLAGLWRGISDGLHSALQGVVHVLYLGINAAYKIILAAVDAWNNIPGNPAHIKGLPRHLDEPSLAHGGVLDRPTRVVVGDAGVGNPEIVTPEHLMARVVRESLAAVLGRGGGVGGAPTVHIDTVVAVDEKRAAHAFGKEWSWQMAIAPQGRL